MATDKQTEANRLNAQKSTGPRTAAGKQRSRLNALKHGLRASMPVLPGEDPEELENLRESLREACQPADALEEVLVAQMVDAEWKRQRLNRFETGLLYYRHCIVSLPDQERYNAPAWPSTPEEQSLFRFGRAVQDLTGENEHLSPLERYGAGARRAFFQALKALVGRRQFLSAHTPPAVHRDTPANLSFPALNPALARPPHLSRGTVDGVIEFA